MNAFDRKIKEVTGSYLVSRRIETVQVNVGLRCNNHCAHCHLQASPERTEAMDWPTMQLILGVVHDARPAFVDITGGAPELNPLLRRFINALREDGQSVQVRTNLTVLLEPEMATMMSFYADAWVKLVASLPCYLKREVDAQRGDGVFEKSIEALKRLNAIGYGSNPHLKLDLVFNPEGAFLPPEQSSLEAEYREELCGNYGIAFDKVLTITNMPIGRFLRLLRQANQCRKYQRLLRESFNPQTVEGLMCRHQIEVGWDGRAYDCDFNLALGIPINYGAPPHIRDFDASRHSRRRVVTGEHFFGCTAGHGSSCCGALVGEGGARSGKAA